MNVEKMDMCVCIVLELQVQGSRKRSILYYSVSGGYAHNLRNENNVLKKIAAITLKVVANTKRFDKIIKMLCTIKQT